jgi:hypothetical protein
MVAAFFQSGTEAALEPYLRLALAKQRFRWLRSTQSSTPLQFRALPHRALKVRPRARLITFEGLR